MTGEVVDFRTADLGFDPWPRNGDCTLGKVTLQICLLHPRVELGTNKCGGKPALGSKNT